MAILSHIDASVRVYAPLLHLLFPIVFMVVGFVVSLLAVPDIAVAAICDGNDACPLVIYLSTVKAAVRFEYSSRLLNKEVNNASELHRCVQHIDTDTKHFYITIFQRCFLPM